MGNLYVIRFLNLNAFLYRQEIAFLLSVFVQGDTTECTFKTGSEYMVQIETSILKFICSKTTAWSSNMIPNTFPHLPLMLFMAWPSAYVLVMCFTKRKYMIITLH